MVEEDAEEDVAELEEEMLSSTEFALQVYPVPEVPKPAEPVENAT